MFVCARARTGHAADVGPRRHEAGAMDSLALARHSIPSALSHRVTANSRDAAGGNLKPSEPESRPAARAASESVTAAGCRSCKKPGDAHP